MSAKQARAAKRRKAVAWSFVRAFAVLQRQAIQRINRELFQQIWGWRRMNGKRGWR